METKMYENMWLSQAKIEAGKQRSHRYQRGRGSCVLFILDFSESMRGEPLRTMKRGVYAILDEFDQHADLDENVTVIVLGQETKFLQYYSNQYSAIKQSIEEVECGGPSPLTAAFLLSLGALFEGTAHTRHIGDFLLYPRVILFTDGRLTDFTDLDAKDSEAHLSPNDQILAPLLSVIHRIGRLYPIFCFPVGENPDYALLQTLSAVSKGGKVLDIYEAKWFGRYSLHYQSADLISKVTNKNEIERNSLRSVAESVLFWQDYDEDDLDTIYELIRNKERVVATQQRVEEDDDENWYKEKYSTIPSLGTRVRRGPHWAFENQDSEGIGTIVGHGDKVGVVLVEWDNGQRCVYSYGRRNVYNIVVCDEPRIPVDGFVAVGCFVKRGPDWSWEDQDGGEEAIGTCYRVMDDATVYVRWPCGRMGNYRFGYDGKYDIELCDPFSPSVMKAVKEQRSASRRSKSETEYKPSPNDLKAGNSKIKGTPHNTTKRRSGSMRKDTGNHTWQGKELNQGRSTVFRGYTDAESTKQLYEQIKSEPVTCNDRENVTDIKTEQSSMAVLVEDLETDEGHDTGPDGDSVGHISGCSEQIETSSSPDEYQNSFSHVKNFVSVKRKSNVNASTIPSNNNFLFESPEMYAGASNINTNYTATRTEMESNIAMNSQDHSEKIDNKSKPQLTSSRLSWQWRDNNGVWVDYPDHVTNLINCRLRQRPMGTVLITYNDESFRIVASKMIQINTQTKERHDIRCRNM